MEHRKALTSTITTIESSNNNHSHHHRRKKRTGKRQQLPPLSSTNNQHVRSVLNTELRSNQPKAQQREQQKAHSPMKNPLAWTKKWTKWFSPCGTQRVSRNDLTTPATTVPAGKRARTKSETDLAKRGSIDQNEKKKLPTTNSSFAVTQPPKENPPIEKVNPSNAVIYRSNSRRYSNTFFTSARYGGPRTSLVAIAPTTLHTLQSKQTNSHLSRSVDRLHSKSSRRELRYEEHDDYIPPLHSIQCHPSIDHYAKNLNPLISFPTNHRRSQIETYQSSSTNNRAAQSRPASSNIPLSYSLQTMSKSSSDHNSKSRNETYGRLSECHSPLTPMENSAVKAPRRIESAYGQFPVQEPVYANTQSLYDNILYPQSASKILQKSDEQEKRSCASQTQLTWTMATFSSFVDLENQSVIIPQPDPNTLYSIVQHYQPEPLTSTSSETLEPSKRLSPNLRYADESSPSAHYQRPRSPGSSPSLVMVEKRDGSFQTHLSIAPTQDLDANRHLFLHDTTPSPISSPSVTTGQQKPHHHHHHHHHRKHKSRSSVTTRDVGLQVNIQTVKKITIIPQKSDESSLTTTTTSSPSLIKASRELRNVETNTEPTTAKRDTSTSYEPSVHLVTSSSQTVDSSASSTTNLQTKAAQTSNKTLRDQSIETNNRGLFVCDLSSLLKNGPDDSSSSTSSSLLTKRKS